jgi:hypothetical protein
MRQLTSKQKKLIDKWFATRQNDLPYGGIKDLPDDLWAELEEINDTEILYQNVDRYILDKIFENNYAR